MNILISVLEEPSPDGASWRRLGHSRELPCAPHTGGSVRTPQAAHGRSTGCRQ